MTDTTPDDALKDTQREMDEAMLAIVKAHNCDDACKPLFGKLCSALKRRDAAARVAILEDVVVDGNGSLTYMRITSKLKDARREYEEVKG